MGICKAEHSFELKLRVTSGGYYPPHGQPKIWQGERLEEGVLHSIGAPLNLAFASDPSLKVLPNLQQRTLFCKLIHSWIVARMPVVACAGVSAGADPDQREVLAAAVTGEVKSAPGFSHPTTANIQLVSAVPPALGRARSMSFKSANPERSLFTRSNDRRSSWRFSSVWGQAPAYRRADLGPSWPACR